MQQEIEKAEKITSASFIWFRPLVVKCNRQNWGSGGLTRELWTMYIKVEEEKEERRTEKRSEIVNEQEEEEREV